MTRLIKNWVTSITGLILLVFAGYLTYTEKIPWETFAAFIPTALLLFRAKDSLLWDKPKDDQP